MFKLTIRKKLLLVCSVLLVIPIVALGWMSYQVSAGETNKLIENGLRNNVRLALEMIGSLNHAVEGGTVTREQAEEDLKVALLGEKQTDGTRPINPKIDLGENGYFFVLDEKGNLLAHPLLEGQNIWDKKTSDGTYYIQDMIKAAQAGGGFTYYDWPLPNSDKEALKVAYAEKDPDWGWIVAAGSYMQDYNGGQRHILSTILLTLAICLAAGGIVLTIFALRLAKPMVRMAESADKMAEGDLTGEPLAANRHDELGRLTVAFNHLRDSLRELAGSQLRGSDELASSSGSLSAIASDAVQAVNETSAAIGEVAQHNERLAGSIEETAKAMEEMALGIQRVAATSTSAYDASLNTLQEAERGGELIRQSISQMAAVSQTVGVLSQVVGRLGNHSEQIGSIAETLKGISYQTNLLALNASIEASRAGEHGKGFAVVAGEVRKLAERSNESAEKVAELIDEIRRDLEASMKSMGQGEREVETGVAAVSETGEAFERIMEATRGVVTQVEEASAASEQMSASAQEIAAALAEMERASARTAGAAQNVSAAAEEQLASFEGIASSARQLSETAERMKQAAGRFRV
ncbi:methyl-accepting chemotaxis protein [Cohnella caldifontis]|uniref:methyl-accepting chemotaxis protein n=1 Tax=Cohnella caldifontis TaxID=3027471 RepID=UPI0023ED0579|nr:methyl-accepting chemotaxis protein [Cohnella sp. YIM B05605]